MIKEVEGLVFSDLQHYVSLERLYWEQSLTGSSGFCHCLDNEAANCSWWMLVEPVGWLEPRSLQGNKQVIFSHNTALLLSFLLVLTLCVSRVEDMLVMISTSVLYKEILLGRCLSPLKCLFHGNDCTSYCCMPVLR